VARGDDDSAGRPSAAAVGAVKVSECEATGNVYAQ
jgi:hypothetical protein